MRVALVCDWFLPRTGGIELHLRDLALALRRRGIDARVVTTTPGAPVVDTVPVLRIPAILAPRAGFAFTPRMLGRLADAMASQRFDVVHAHASVVSPVAYGGALIAARAGVPAVLTFHSMLHGSSFLIGASETLFGWARDRILLTAVSSVVASQAARWLPHAAVGILPNGVDAGFWHRTARRDGAEGDEVVFVSAMRLSRKKRPAALLRAFADVVRFTAGAPAARLIVAGDGPDRAALRRYAVELGVGARVELVGHLTRDELRAVYDRAHVFVLPGERESFGIAALEARAAGLPVVAMLSGGVRDFIAQSVDGLLARDERELARCMARMAVEAPFRDFVTHHNRASPPPYDWNDVAELHERFYDAAGALRRPAGRASQM